MFKYLKKYYHNNTTFYLMKDCVYVFYKGKNNIVQEFIVMKNKTNFRII